MIVTIKAGTAMPAKHADAIEQMFRQRARRFGHWPGVTVTHGREVDEFDTAAATYILHIEHNVVIGSLRLLPTTGPTLFEKMHPGLIMPREGMWEVTRFCSEGNLSDCAKLLVGLGEHCLANGINSIVGDIETPILRLYERVGCQLTSVGFFKITEEQVERVRQRAEPPQRMAS